MIAPISRSSRNSFLHLFRILICALVALVFLLVISLTVNAQAIVFGTGATYGVGDGPFGMTAGDFNGDGRPDLAVANHGSSVAFHNGVLVLIANPDGTFQN